MAFLLDIGITLTLVTCLIRLIIISWPTIVLSFLQKQQAIFLKVTKLEEEKKMKVRWKGSQSGNIDEMCVCVGWGEGPVTMVD